MSKHTPGPWVVGDDCNGLLRYRSDGHMVIDNDTDTRFAVCDTVDGADMVATALNAVDLAPREERQRLFSRTLQQQMSEESRKRFRILTEDA